LPAHDALPSNNPDNRDNPAVIRRALRWARDLHHGFRQTEQVYMVVVAVVIGLLGGLSAVGLRSLIGVVNDVAWHRTRYTLDYLAALPWWWKLIAPTVGGLIVGWITYYFASEARGHGVPEVMEAVALRGGRIRPRVVFAKLIASGICIGSGGSTGREGPVVQIGAALGSTFGQWLRIDPRRLRTLVGCGAAAGIAGTFNAPVAGALFAVEIILGDFGVTQFSPIVISSVAATVVSQRFLGDFPAFEVPPYSLVHASEFLAYAVLGVLAAFVGVAFIRILYRVESMFEDLRIAGPAKAVLGGLLIGVMGIWVPHVFGVGYEAINEALHGNLAWEFMLLLVVLKIFAVSITLGSGGSGGIFAPSLFIGAMLGGAVGTVVHSIWPTSAAGAGAYALVGMGAVVGAATHAPITAILIIFELTGDYQIIMPLMISCIIATLLSTRIQRASIYTLKLLRRGIDVYRGRAVNVLQHLVARDVMRGDVVTLPPEEGLVSLVSKFIGHPGSTLFVTQDGDQLLGIVTAEQVRPVMQDPAAFESLVIAADVMVEAEYPSVTPETRLDQVMRLLGQYRGEIPVLDNGKLAGVIWPEDVIQRYNTEVLKRDMAGSVVGALSSDDGAEGLRAAPDAMVSEVHVPLAFVGKTIGELDIRRQFGVSIVMIRHTGATGETQLTSSPAADYAFRGGDVMLVMGPEEALRNVRRGVPATA
jgi:CIC family chloride channel protein